MAIEEVLPGVYGVGMGYVNAFLIVEETVSLVDSGTPRRMETVLGALRQLGRAPTELKHIVITHHHSDHTGSLAALTAACGDARVYMHPLEASIVRGDATAPGLSRKGILGAVLAPVLARLASPRIEPARVDQEVQDGAVLPLAGGLTAVHTPGHTAGHLAYLKPGRGGVLFVGDAAANFFGRLGPPLSFFTEEMDQAKASMRKLAELEFDVACFGHGRVLRGRANAAFRRRVEKMAR